MYAHLDHRSCWLTGGVHTYNCNTSSPMHFLQLQHMAQAHNRLSGSAYCFEFFDLASMLDEYTLFSFACTEESVLSCKFSNGIFCLIRGLRTKCLFSERNTCKPLILGNELNRFFSATIMWSPSSHTCNLSLQLGSSHFCSRSTVKKIAHETRTSHSLGTGQMV